MMNLKKKVSAPIIPHVFIPRIEALLSRIMRGRFGTVTWYRVSMKQPQPLLELEGVSASDVDAWLAKKSDHPDLPTSGFESYPIDLTKSVSSSGNATGAGAGPGADSSSISDPLIVENTFKNLFAQLSAQGQIQKIPNSVSARVFFFPESTGVDDAQISPNELWHIDFVKEKSAEQLQTLLTKEAYQCICTITAPGGPTTLVLDGVDEIEIPILDATGIARSGILDAYIDGLLKLGILKMSALRPNTWYFVDTKLIHSGPHKLDSQFYAASRAFLHVTSESLSVT